MIDREYGSLLSLSPHIKILATTCRIDEIKSQAFPFGSISRLSAARFMTSSEKSFWVVDGITFWQWKK